MLNFGRVDWKQHFYTKKWSVYYRLTRFQVHLQQVLFFDPSVSKRKLQGTYSWLGHGVFAKVRMQLLELECELILELLAAALQHMKPAFAVFTFKSVTVMRQVRVKSYENSMVWNVTTAYKVAAKQNKNLRHRTWVVSFSASTPASRKSIGLGL